MSNRAEELSRDPQFRADVAAGDGLQMLKAKHRARFAAVKEARSMVLGEALQKPAAVTTDTPPPDKSDWDERGDKATWEAQNTRIHTFEALAAHAQIDLDVWEIERKLVNSWEVGMKGDDGEPIVQPLFQVKAWFKRRRDVVNARTVVESIFAKAAERAPVYPKIVFPKKRDKHLLVMSIPDHHFGMQAWHPETGGPDYDLKIAKTCYRNAVHDLVTMASNFECDEVLYPIGNDVMHIDSPRNQTYAGTPQDVDTRYPKIFEECFRTLVESIDLLQTVAPRVRVVVIPGNHDPQATYHLGMCLQSWYRNCGGVEVDNGPKMRKYFEHGKLMLCLTHGDKEKHAQLPIVMAQERPDMWGRTLFHEIHLGHLHHLRETAWRDVGEYQGVRVRILPSLTPPDAWHSSQGYISIRASQALVYHPERGYVAQFSHTPRVEKTE